MQQQHYSQDLSLPHQSSQSTSSASSFSRDARPRSRSQSLSITVTSNTTGNTLNSIIPSSSSPSSAKKPVVIPARPRPIPPRPPQVSAPRKYHGRQPRKAPAPTIDHQQVSGLREFVPPARRMAHILSEQKRREKINAGFEELKSVIPECAQNTDSKASILRKAVDRILELENELRKYTDEFHYVPEDPVEREE
ncbi:hypothetical protein BGZ80_011479 [Entomortierella chlamydospora]|uniref:BHLH domain-containing protein n=1 Tax=Entomortierella chlamydospora TaxID=101097 RepID=A0A9P6SZ43_9FUNG|nr:hypothetical protein BGZ80_011479 [Entomortierella chlamydospora]